MAVLCVAVVRAHPESILCELQKCGMAPQDYGSHSARKGAVTFVSSCTTAGPSAASICLRAGWTLPGVQKSYVRYEAAGDQVVGRFVSGLPYGSAQFATLPPFFATQLPEMDDAVTACFPGVPDSMRLICEFALASLCYHANFLKTALSASHPLFGCELFRNPALLAKLQPLVVCRLGENGDRIRPTGIPPHVALVVEIEKMGARISNSLNGLAEVVSTAGRQATQNADPQISVVVERAVERTIRGLGLAPTATPVETIHAPTVAPQTSSTTTEAATTLRHWNGRLYRVPHDFVFPGQRLSIMWQYWCLGNDAEGHPPYRLLQRADLHVPNSKKRLDQLRRMMEILERAAREQGLWKNSPSSAEVAEWFIAVKHKLPISTTTARGRTRRIEQLSWLTLMKDL